ncbi:MAG: hypothetical protein U0V70_03485 [Terriglobia bacterium]
MKRHRDRFDGSIRVHAIPSQACSSLNEKIDCDWNRSGKQVNFDFSSVRPSPKGFWNTDEQGRLPMLKRSTLYETHLSAGAQFTDLFGWEVPETFTGVSEEYQALQNAIRLLDCTQSGIIEVSGDDRTRFLHGMLTNDIKQLEPGRGCYAGFLTPQGRLLGDMRVYCLEDSFWLTIDSSLRDQIPAALENM